MSDGGLLLQVSDIAKSFGSVVALRSATLGVRPGEVHALMGANGAGKSTLVKILTGVFRADSGTIAIRGVAQTLRSPAEARRAGIVSVYQDPALVPDLTVAQNVRLADVAMGPTREWMKELGIDDVDLGEYVRDLPYPVLRLIDLARALASDPPILLLDEITAALPADLSERVFRIVRRWREARAFGDLHFAPHGRGRRALRPGDGASRRGHRRRHRHLAGQRGPHRLADARAGRRQAPTPAARARGRRTDAPPGRRRRSRCAASAPAIWSTTSLLPCGPARCWASRRWKVRASRSCSTALPACAAPTAVRSRQTGRP